MSKCATLCIVPATQNLPRVSSVFRLKPLDIAFMKAAHYKVNIVPVIAKADTLTKMEVQKLKKKVLCSYAYL